MIMKNIAKTAAAAVFSLCISAAGWAQANTLQPRMSSADKNQGFEEFRRGVQAYYRGTFNEAILLFEKALSYVPDDPLILDWLGHAYYRSGIEGAALEQWEAAAASGYGGQLLKNRVEVVKERRSSVPDFAESIRFVETAAFEAKHDAGLFFKQPVSVAALKDGSFWVVAYGSNELVHFDINGIVLERTAGPLQGFDRPFDILPLKNGTMLISEFAADRLSLLKEDGTFIKSFGSRGRGEGQFVGPQFLASDSYGNIFVTDFGNARVVVLSPDGEGLFTFGQRSGIFSGFTAPAGIAILDDLVYVADSVKGAIYVFDTAGNYIRTLLPEGSVVQAESMRVWKNNLLLSCSNKVYLVDISLASLYTVASLGNAPARVTAAIPDINGSLLLADYKNGNIQVFSHINELAGGLFVRFDRVYSDKFPNVTLDVRVENRAGQPLVGLTEKNFFVTESNRAVNDLTLKGAAYLNTGCEISIIIERSPQSEKEIELIRTVVKELAEAMQGKGMISIISASQIPVLEGKYAPETLISKQLAIKSSWSAVWNCDLAVRLASGELINAPQKRGIIFLSFEDIGSESFKQYSLNDLAAYMRNNGIRFYAVNLKPRALPAELAYLCVKTGGMHTYLYAEKGLSPIIEDLIDKPVGMYQLNYNSVLPTDFGRAYLPVEVEVRLLNRSGRDETGYFAPLQ
ncbi:MAG: tetratricopeptide repeat protein [Treponema sp.]